MRPIVEKIINLLKEGTLPFVTGLHFSAEEAALIETALQRNRHFSFNQANYWLQTYITPKVKKEPIIEEPKAERELTLQEKIRKAVQGHSYAKIEQCFTDMLPRLKSECICK